MALCSEKKQAPEYDRVVLRDGPFRNQILTIPRSRRAEVELKVRRGCRARAVYRGNTEEGRLRFAGYLGMPGDPLQIFRHEEGA